MICRHERAGGASSCVGGVERTAAVERRQQRPGITVVSQEIRSQEVLFLTKEHS
jgi:hypothetical protein